MRIAEQALSEHGFATRRYDRAMRGERSGMLACGCTNLGDVLMHLAGLGLKVMAVLALALGLVCLMGLLLSAIAALGHLARRRQSGDHEDGDAGPDGEHVTLASFRWETAQEADDTR